ncbi:transmembrane protease serine 2-like isoform X2 [Narcine bancroftii]|uniref:transmembrane protease serine 2-like isoform X2 n=1 Tax=Narcine bancroftii TaxID=1343680 RepID=UPI00383151E8
MSFFTNTGGNPLTHLHYARNTLRLFQPSSSVIYVPPISRTHLPPVYGSQTFNKNSFVAMTAKKRNIFIGLMIAGALFFFGILAAIIWYFISTSHCIPCGYSTGCVAPLQWCDGVPQCPRGEDEQCYQLVSSDFVLYAKSKGDGWRPVCHDNWSKKDAKQVCRMMGYPRRSYFKYGSAPASTIGTSEFFVLNESIKKQSIYNKLSISKSCESGLVITLRCIECGTRKPFTNASGRIVGGRPASQGEFPWQVSLQVQNRHVCGGTLLTPHWIITAAHCEGRFNSPYYWQVYGGQIKLSEAYPQIVHKVEKMIIHEMFDSETKDFDIALLKLLTPFKFSDVISPICLPNYGQAFPSGSASWVSGWGDSREGGMISEVLQKVLLPLVDTEDCEKLYIRDITARMICAGFSQGGFDACQGDSGGPLSIYQNSSWWLVGTTSWGVGCGRENKPGVYTKISAVLDWIYLQLKQA